VSAVGAVLPAAVAAAAGLGAAALSYRQANKAVRAQVRMDRVKVDAAAYDRAREMYEAGIAQLEGQVRRATADLETERTARRAAEEREAKLRVRVAALEQITAHLPGAGEAEPA